MDNFRKWLISRVSETSADKYSLAIKTISSDMLNANITEKSLYEYSNLLELEFVIDRILNNDNFIKKNFTGHNMYSSALNHFIEYKSEFECYKNIQLTEEDTSFPEGKEVLRKHIVRERNQDLIKNAKRKFKKENGEKLFCQICSFDFSVRYGELGSDYIEAHHIKPVSEMKDGERTNIEDIIMVCSNCHSMIHRKRPWVTKDHLLSLLLTNT